MICFVIVFLFASAGLFVQCNKINSFLTFRGGIVPETETNEEYFRYFQLDYGLKDVSRPAGFLGGFLSINKLRSLSSSDNFLKWLYKYIETGPESFQLSRTKPYYAADFGKKTDLQPGENPKIIIVNRKLNSNEDGFLAKTPNNDVEVREIWQPWLKSKCDFVVRYIVPNRANILRIMENKKQFSAYIEKDPSDNSEKCKSWVKMIFRPNLFEKLTGKKDVIIKHALENNGLFNLKKAAVEEDSLKQGKGIKTQRLNSKNAKKSRK